MSTTYAQTLATTSPAQGANEGQQCICADPEVDRLRDLIRQGYSQHEASRIVWGTTTSAHPPVQHDLLRDQVQQLVAENRRRWPRLFLETR